MPDLHLPTSLGTKRARWIAASAIVIVLGGVGYWLMRAPAPAPTAAIPPAIPVQTASAAQSDVPIYFDGLGTVQAFNTVTVTTRVDGQLQRVTFVEGQDVKTGDTLGQIDPRTYQATYDQAVSNKAKDDALLANAKLDLQRYDTLAPQNYTSKQTLDTQKALVKTGPGGHRVRSHESRLHDDQIADQRPHGHSSRRCRQQCARRSQYQPRCRHADAADLRNLHAACGRSAGVHKGGRRGSAYGDRALTRFEDSA